MINVYVRKQFGKERITPIVNMIKSLKRLKRDYYNGFCNDGVIYEHETNTAISVVPVKVSSEWENVTLDTYQGGQFA
jgi:hypothetical protein